MQSDASHDNLVAHIPIVIVIPWPLIFVVADVGKAHGRRGSGQDSPGAQRERIRRGGRAQAHLKGA